MRRLYKSGPAVYRDDFATRDIRKLKKVQSKFIIITVASIKYVMRKLRRSMYIEVT